MAGPSQAQVAQAAGVGQRTVSRVFLDPSRVEADTRELVLGAARRLGYQPQRRQLRQTHSVLFLDDPDPTRSQLIGTCVRALSQGLAVHGVTLVHAVLPDATWHDGRKLLRTIRAHSVDALCLGYHGPLPAGLQGALESLNIPFLWLNRRSDSDAVLPDECGAARSAVEHALALGHRRIAWLEWQHDADRRDIHFSAPARLAGCRLAVRAAGLPLRHVLLPDGTATDPLGAAQACLRNVLREPQAPTLLIGQAEEPSLAWSTFSGLSAPRIPQDCSLLFLGLDHDSIVPLPPSATRVDWQTLGTTAANILAARLHGAPSGPAQFVPCIWLPGATLVRALGKE